MDKIKYRYLYIITWSFLVKTFTHKFNYNNNVVKTGIIFVFIFPIISQFFIRIKIRSTTKNQTLTQKMSLGHSILSSKMSLFYTLYCIDTWISIHVLWNPVYKRLQLNLYRRWVHSFFFWSEYGNCPTLVINLSAPNAGTTPMCITSEYFDFAILHFVIM